MNLDEYRAGSTEPWALDIIAAVIRAKKPSVVIETGTFEGRGTEKLIEAMSSYGAERMSRLYTIDADRDRAAAAWDRVSPRLPRAPDPTPVSVDFIVGDALEYLRRFDGQADIIFLDDDHEAQHVRAELDAALRILRPGGVVFLHDVVGIFGLDRVVRDAGGIVLDLPRYHISGGLGIVSK